MALAQQERIRRKDVRELQRLAREAPIAAGRRSPKSSSRAALLELIDILSRWSAAGLALIAGVGAYLAIAAGRVYPARALAWSLMLVAALWVCRRLHSAYRSGAAISAKPFRWRASYTSCLSVLGVVLASAPLLLTPAGAPMFLSLQTVALAMFAAFGAAALHSAHVPSAAAFAAPAVVLPLLATLRPGDSTSFLLPLALAAPGVLAVLTLAVAVAHNARRRNPRTAFLRREIERTDATGRVARPAAAHSGPIAI